MPRQGTPLTDTRIKSLKPQPTRYRTSDTGGLLLEVMPSGAKIWRYRYQLYGVRQAPLTIGSYPEVSLADARKKRDEWASLVARGASPKDAVLAVKTAHLNTVEAFGCDWLETQIEGKSVSYSTTMRRIFEKDVVPSLGNMPLKEVKPSHILKLCDRIKDRGSPKMALVTRHAVRRMFDYAIARQMVDTNPASAVVARFIATQESRTRNLTGQEIGDVMRAIYQSDIRRSFRLALHLLLITMVRKSELTEAKWTEVDFEASVWDIPKERMKTGKPHRVYLSRQAKSMLYELKQASGGSAYVLPSSRGTTDRPISKSTLNISIRSLSLEVQHFVLHDFRRTASTHLNGMEYSSEAIEKALAHEIGGIKGVYNRGEYPEQRKVILQAWADFVDEQIRSVPGDAVPV